MIAWSKIWQLRWPFPHTLNQTVSQPSPSKTLLGGISRAGVLGRATIVSSEVSFLLIELRGLAFCNEVTRRLIRKPFASDTESWKTRQTISRHLQLFSPCVNASSGALYFVMISSGLRRFLVIARLIQKLLLALSRINFSNTVVYDLGLMSKLNSLYIYSGYQDK